MDVRPNFRQIRIADVRFSDILCTLFLNLFFQIGEKSEQQGYNASRLPEFTAEEKAEIAGSSDFLGINHYTTSLVFPMDPDSPDSDKIGYPYDSGVQSTIDKKWYP